MVRQVFALLLVMLGLVLQGCAATAAVLDTYVDQYDGYRFSYPPGWVEVKVDDGPDIVFHDLIETTENVSVVISKVPDGKSLQELGSPSEVGYRLSKNAIAPEKSGRTAELVNAEARALRDVPYYLLEYAVKLPNQQERHNLASVVVRRGKLYTFNVSTTEQRWTKKQALFHQIVDSFQVN